MKKKILLICTGGTIASRKTQDGLAPQISAEDILSYVPGARNYADIDAVQVCNIDSTNMTPAHWQLLVETVESYNAACAAGVDEAFGKQEKYLRALGEGPYYAVTGCAHSYSTTGGLDVNTSFQVLQADGATPINGLYAVGTDCSGVLYTDKKAYVTYGGAAQGWAYTSGYVCGKLVADSVAAGE